jgi:hypothetical protein
LHTHSTRTVHIIINLHTHSTHHSQFAHTQYTSFSICTHTVHIILNLHTHSTHHSQISDACPHPPFVSISSPAFRIHILTRLSYSYPHPPFVFISSPAFRIIPSPSMASQVLYSLHQQHNGVSSAAVRHAEVIRHLLHHLLDYLLTPPLPHPYLTRLLALHLAHTSPHSLAHTSPHSLACTSPHLGAVISVQALVLSLAFGSLLASPHACAVLTLGSLASRRQSSVGSLRRS